MAKTKVYDSASVVVIFNGVKLEGFAPGSRVTITPAAAAFTKKVGSDGEVARSKSNDKTATVKCKLMQTSSSNTLLSAIYNLDVASPNGAGIGPLFIKDLNGDSTYAAAKAWIKQLPESAFDQEAGEREWEFETGDLTANVGGN